MTRVPRIRVAAIALVMVLGVVTFGSISASADTLICETFGSVSIQNGQYIVQNNVWGASTAQCINVTDTGFQVTTANHNKPTNGAPASYPSIYKGCHYNNCTSGSPFPATINSLGTINSSVSITTPNSGEWNAAYDVWYDPTPRRDGQNTGTELMIWINHRGAPQPIGSRVATVTIGGAAWDVWYGNTGWNVVSYVRQQTSNSFSGSLTAFQNDAISRGYIQQSWYVTSVQYGFEPWIGGAGLAVNSFSVTTGGTTTTTAATTTTRAATTTTTRAATTTTTRAATTTTGGTGGVSCSVTRLDQWGSGYVAYVRVTNNGSPVTSWSVPLTFNQSTTVTNSWNVNLSGSGSTRTASNTSGNGNLGTGASVDFGFQGTASGNITVSCGGGTGTTTTTRAATTTTTRAATTTTTRAATTTTTRAATTTTTRAATTTTGGSGGVSCSVTRVDQWGSGYVAYVRVTNNGAPVSSWSKPLTFNQSTTVTNSWNVNLSGSGSSRTASNLSWNGNLGTGASVDFGFQGTASGNFTVSCS